MKFSLQVENVEIENLRTYPKKTLNGSVLGYECISFGESLRTIVHCIASQLHFIYIFSASCWLLNH